MLTEWYPQQLLEFEMPNFQLRNDLEQLSIVYQHSVPEATVFYSGRILEALSSSAVEALGGKAKANVFANLEYIDDFHFLDPVTRYWAHALRRMGNQVRHILGPLEADAHHVAIALLDTWLKWYFTQYPLGPSLPSFSQRQESQLDIFKIFNQLSQQLSNTDFNAELFNQQHSDILLHPALVSVIIEKLLDRKDYTVADQLILQALERSPSDLRLIQLQGLSMSRQNHLKQACQILSQLNKRFPNDDETMGILGGVYKRMWSESGNAQHLQRAGKLYEQGWRNSKQRNAYLGINAASIKLWQNQADSAKEIASAITEQFELKQNILKEKFPNEPFRLNFWDQETLAQAAFLAGKEQDSVALYKELLDPKRHPDKPFNVVIGQLKQHFTHMPPSNELLSLINSVAE